MRGYQEDGIDSVGKSTKEELMQALEDAGHDDDQYDNYQPEGDYNEVDRKSTRLNSSHT